MSLPHEFEGTEGAEQFNNRSEPFVCPEWYNAPRLDGGQVAAHQLERHRCIAAQRSNTVNFMSGKLSEVKKRRQCQIVEFRRKLNHALVMR